MRVSNPISLYYSQAFRSRFIASVDRQSNHIPSICPYLIESSDYSHSICYGLMLLLHWCQKDDTRVAFAFVFPGRLMSRALALSGVITGCAVVRHGGTPTVATKGWSASNDPELFHFYQVVLFHFFINNDYKFLINNNFLITF